MLTPKPRLILLPQGSPLRSQKALCMPVWQRRVRGVRETRLEEEAGPKFHQALKAQLRHSLGVGETPSGFNGGREDLQSTYGVGGGQRDSFCGIERSLWQNWGHRMRRSILEVGTPGTKLLQQLIVEVWERGAWTLMYLLLCWMSLLEKFQKSKSLVSRIFPKSLLLPFSFLLFFVPIPQGDSRSQSRRLSRKQVIKEEKAITHSCWEAGPYNAVAGRKKSV